MDGWMGWDGWDLSQTTTTIRAPLAVLKRNQMQGMVIVAPQMKGVQVMGAEEDVLLREIS